MYAQFTAHTGGFNVGHDTRPSPQPPVTILGVTGTPLHHPQPISLPMSFGTTLTFPTAPTSPPTMGPPITKPCHHQATFTQPPGTGPYRTGSSHPSLYQPSRNPSPAPQLPISIHQGTATGRMSRSSTVDPSIALHEQLPGSDSPGDSESNHSLHRSYSHPLSHSMDIS